MHTRAVLRLPCGAAISLATPLPTPSGVAAFSRKKLTRKKQGPERSTRSLSVGPTALYAEADKRELRDLARGGVYHAPAVTSRAVRSYRTLSPLPVLVGQVSDLSFRKTARRAVPPAIGGLLSVALARARDRRGRVGVTHHRVLPCSDFPHDDDSRRRHQRAAALPHL
jgi:hypothetical protein